MSEVSSQTLTELTVTLLAAFTQNNTVRSDDLPNLILATHGALVITAGEAVPPSAEEPKDEPAVSIRKSLASPAFIISMIDGKPYKSLKRHLTAQGISPDQYRERYNLPASYPMVAPEYSNSRREFAMSNGLGRPRPLQGAEPSTAPLRAPRRPEAQNEEAAPVRKPRARKSDNTER